MLDEKTNVIDSIGFCDTNEQSRAKVNLMYPNKRNMVL